MSTLPTLQTLANLHAIARTASNQHEAVEAVKAAYPEAKAHCSIDRSRGADFWVMGVEVDGNFATPSNCQEDNCLTCDELNR